MIKNLLSALIIFTLLVAGCSAPVQRESPVPRPLAGKDSRRLIKELRQHIGEPYRYGGTTSKGWDCSGFVRTAYNRILNVELPRSSEDMYSGSVEIPIRKAVAGDLVFFNIGGKKPTHVGVYIGSSAFIHVSTSSGVITSTLTEDYYRRHFLGIRRFHWNEVAISR